MNSGNLSKKKHYHKKFGITMKCLCFCKILIPLFSKDALHCWKITVKTCIMLQMTISISNKCYSSNVLFIKESSTCSNDSCRPHAFSSLHSEASVYLMDLFSCCCAPGPSTSLSLLVRSSLLSYFKTKVHGKTFISLKRTIYRGVS